LVACVLTVRSAPVLTVLCVLLGQRAWSLALLVLFVYPTQRRRCRVPPDRYARTASHPPVQLVPFVFLETLRRAHLDFSVLRLRLLLSRVRSTAAPAKALQGSTAVCAARVITGPLGPHAALAARDRTVLLGMWYLVQLALSVPLALPRLRSARLDRTPPSKARLPALRVRHAGRERTRHPLVPRPPTASVQAVLARRLMRPMCLHPRAYGAAPMDMRVRRAQRACLVSGVRAASRINVLCIVSHRLDRRTRTPAPAIPDTSATRPTSGLACSAMRARFALAVEPSQ